MHAALASIVSAWEGYVEAITIEAIDTIANCSNAEVLLLTTLIKAEAKVAIAKFNTPTAENCRGLYIEIHWLRRFSIYAVSTTFTYSASCESET